MTPIWTAAGYDEDVDSWVNQHAHLHLLHINTAKHDAEAEMALDMLTDAWGRKQLTWLAWLSSDEMPTAALHTVPHLVLSKCVCCGRLD